MDAVSPDEDVGDERRDSHLQPAHFPDLAHVPEKRLNVRALSWRRGLVLAAAGIVRPQAWLAEQVCDARSLVDLFCQASRDEVCDVRTV